MDILEHMDVLLAGTIEHGDAPNRWIVREEDWRALAQVYASNDALAKGVFAARQYKDAPVEFGDLGEREIVVLVTDIDGRRLSAP